MNDRKPDPHVYRAELLLGWTPAHWGPAGQVTAWYPGRSTSTRTMAEADDLATWLRVRQWKVPYWEVMRLAEDLAFQLWIPSSGTGTQGWHGSIRRCLVDAVEEVNNYDRT